MASKTKGFGIQFYDNDGSLSWFANSACAGDIQRQYLYYGKWKARWLIVKLLYRAFRSLESMKAVVKVEGEEK